VLFLTYRIKKLRFSSSNRSHEAERPGVGGDDSAKTCYGSSIGGGGKEVTQTLSGFGSHLSWR
jgi:hypothetical protein